MARQHGADAERAFEREARLLAGLRHAALPVVIDYFVDDGRHFIVMQYIEGEDLARVLQRQNGPCAGADVLQWAEAALDALAYLHDHRPPIVHRDIKPANLKRTPSGDVVLLDFGLAKGSAGARAASDGERSLLGFTLKYAPLEQIAGHGTDARSDIFSLGATLYHLATGLAPATAVDRVGALNSGRPDPLREAIVVNTALPEVLSRALTKALEIDPSGRFQSASEMRAALVGASAAHEGKRPVTPRPEARRIDAAMPSQAEVGRQTDLIVQVRFANSPLLGLEDWPTHRRPEAIDQASDAIELRYPEDAVTGALLPARLRLRLVAPDFTIEGQAEQLIEVPPDTYSKRVTFLLTPRRAGYCRVNVEVYTPDALYLGTVPVEAEALRGGIAQPIIRVANLMLGLLARRVADAIHRAPDASTIVVDQSTRPPDPIRTQLAAPQPTIAAQLTACEQTTAATIPLGRTEASATTVPATKRLYATTVVAAVSTVAVLLVAAAVTFQSVDRPASAPGGGADEHLTPIGTVAVSLNISPWARIHSITSRTDRKRIEIDCPATPCAFKLPPGEYVVTASNPDFPPSMTFTITVVAGQDNQVAQMLPAFNVPDAVNSIEKRVAWRGATEVAPPAPAPTQRAAEDKRLADARAERERQAKAQQLADARAAAARAAEARAADERRSAEARGNAGRWSEPYDKALSALKKEQYDTAIPLLQQAIAIDPSAQRNKRVEATVTEDYFPQYYLFYAYVKSKQYDKARPFASASRPPKPQVADFQVAFTEYTQTVAATTALAANNAQLKLDQAMREQKAAAAQADFDNFVKIGDAALRAKHYAQAQNAYEQAKAKLPDEFGRRGVQKKLDMITAQIGAMSEDARATSEFQASVTAARSALDAKRYDEAIRQLEAARQRSPDDFTKQNLQAKLDEANRAKLAAMPAQASAPAVDFDRYTRDGLTALLTGQPQRAKEAFELALGAGKAAPAQRAMAHAYLAVAYASLALQSSGDARVPLETRARDEYRQAGGYLLPRKLVSPAVMALLTDRR